MLVPLYIYTFKKSITKSITKYTFKKSITKSITKYTFYNVVKKSITKYTFKKSITKHLYIFINCEFKDFALVKCNSF